MEIYGAVTYRKVREIGVGQGRNSKVYLAEDPHLDRMVAVKEIDRTRIAPAGWDAYHQEARAMFVSRHDRVVPIHHACLTASHVALVMPHYPSGSLQDRTARGPLPLREAYRIADEILAGLYQVHVANVLHFDLKPSNVLFSEDGHPLIADFGQARMMDQTGVAPMPAMYRFGTPPEFFAGAVGTVESDVYQAGLTLYRMFNGDGAYQDQVRQLRLSVEEAIAKGRFPNRRRFLPHVPPGIQRVIRKALQVHPENRYHSASEFQDALGRVSVRFDWEPAIGSDGEISWKARRGGQAELEVRQAPDSGGLWSVEVHTLNNSRRRRKGVDSLWARRLSVSQVRRHLSDVFRRLESG